MNITHFDDNTVKIAGTIDVWAYEIQKHNNPMCKVYAQNGEHLFDLCGSVKSDAVLATAYEFAQHPEALRED